MQSSQILAMIGASYFADPPSKIRGMETAAAEYAEMGKAEQERRGKETIDAFENLGDPFLSIFSSMRCAVYACATEKTSCVWFRTGFEEAVLCMCGEGYVTDARIVHGWKKEDWKRYLSEIVSKEEKEKEAEKRREKVRELKMRFLSENDLLKCGTRTERLGNGDVRVEFFGKGKRTVHVLQGNEMVVLRN